MALRIIAAFYLPVLLTIIYGSDANADFPKWSRLSARFGQFNELPICEKKAQDGGWKLLSDDCSKDSSGPFFGKRYVYKGDRTTILIFDADHHIAGMQMGFLKKLKKGAYGTYADVFQSEDGYYYVTAYFTNPKKICETVKRNKDIIGDRLWIVSGSKYVKAPLLQENVGSTKWVEGACFWRMGTHYWYDVSSDMDCNDIFPVFILYNNKGKLAAWGFATDVNVKSSRAEKPPKQFRPVFFKRGSYPKCFGKLDVVSTQHVYFIPKVDILKTLTC